MLKFNVGDKVRINQPSHARHGQTGSVLHHADYGKNGEPAAEVVAFEKIGNSCPNRYVVDKFPIGNVELVR